MSRSKRRHSADANLPHFTPLVCVQAPRWSPSTAVLKHATGENVPYVQIYEPRQGTNFSINMPATMLRLTSAPAHGQLTWQGAPIGAGSEIPNAANLTFLSRETTNTSIGFWATGGSRDINTSLTLLAAANPSIVPFPSTCNWALGASQCSNPAFTATLREDSSATIFLIGRSFHGYSRTVATITQVPRNGTLYQVASCCDPVAGRGTAMSIGDEVLDPSSAIVYEPPADKSGDDLESLTFFVRDLSGRPSTPATLSLSVAAVEDTPKLATIPTIATTPLTPVFIPFSGTDPEGSMVTFTLSRAPLHGKVRVGDKAGPELRAFSGALSPDLLLRQHAVDLIDVSSLWPNGVVGPCLWHPLAALGKQGEVTQP